MFVSQFSATMDISCGKDAVTSSLLDILPDNDLSVDSSRYKECQLFISSQTAYSVTVF